MPILIIIACIIVFRIARYKKTSYYKATHNSLLSVKFNSGRYGEYATYKYLKFWEENGARLLFNAYLPKNETETTEVDLIMIHQKGIFVFESKNYSGWIFGDERSRTWTQCLPKGKKAFHKRSIFKIRFIKTNYIFPRSKRS